MRSSDPSYYKVEPCEIACHDSTHTTNKQKEANVIESLYQYNDWAHGRILQLATGLTDEQLDHRLEMGFGTLRATLFHIVAAEQIWLERWTRQPWRSFPIDPQGASLAEIEEGLRQVSAKRREFIEANRLAGWSDSITYRDGKQVEHTNNLAGMLIHVANHGIHHRAQALYFLKQFGRTVAGGLDYLFFRIAYPTVPLIDEYVEPMRQFGLEVGSGTGQQVDYRKPLMQDFFAYHDWALQLLLELAKDLDRDALHRDFNMGMGTIHKSLAHLRDAEKWWLGNWNNQSSTFPAYQPLEPMSMIAESRKEIATQRNQIIETSDDVAMQRVVIANPGKIRFPVRVIESMVQLCCHGTHHRAQIVNMLRQMGIQSSGIDFIVWLRNLESQRGQTNRIEGRA